MQASFAVATVLLDRDLKMTPVCPARALLFALRHGNHNAGQLRDQRTYDILSVRICFGAQRICFDGIA